MSKNVKAIKTYLMNNTRLSYPLSRQNPRYKNITRIEALKAELHQLNEKAPLDASQFQQVTGWIEKVEQRYCSDNK